MNEPERLEPIYHPELVKKFFAATNKAEFREIAEGVADMPLSQIVMFVVQLCFCGSDRDDTLFRMGILGGTLSELSGGQDGLEDFLAKRGVLGPRCWGPPTENN